MSILFASPWNAPTTTVSLRDPQLGDSLDVGVKVRVTTMMDGSVRTRRSTPANKVRRLRFIGISRNKALQVLAFVKLTQGTQVRYVDYDGTSWRGYLTTDPEDFRTYSRGSGNEPRPEDVEITLSFEGVQM